jgi:hypothetical protein
VNIDYHEVQRQPGGELIVHIGIQFEDEPDALYVVHITADSEAQVKDWQLLYNGFDCKYTFKSEEKYQLLNHLEQDGLKLIIE